MSDLPENVILFPLQRCRPSADDNYERRIPETIWRAFKSMEPHLTDSEVQWINRIYDFQKEKGCVSARQQEIVTDIYTKLCRRARGE